LVSRTLRPPVMGPLSKRKSIIAHGKSSEPSLSAQACGSRKSTKPILPRPATPVTGARARMAWKVCEAGSPIRQENGRAAHVERYTTVTSTQPGTFSRPGMTVLPEEAPPLPRERQSFRAEAGADVKKTIGGRFGGRVRSAPTRPCT
jgi:hypothetical protein